MVARQSGQPGGRAGVVGGDLGVRAALLPCLAAGTLPTPLCSQPCHRHCVLRTPPSHCLCSTMDDPTLFSAMLPWPYFLTEHLHHNMRWTLCAREICYRNLLLGQFFQSGKTLPVVRGEGLSQPIMATVAGEVAHGRWLHIFPEGRVNYTGTLGPMRWGVGKVVCDALLKTDRWACGVGAGRAWGCVACLPTLRTSTSRRLLRAALTHTHLPSSLPALHAGTRSCCPSTTAAWGRCCQSMAGCRGLGTRCTW